MNVREGIRQSLVAGPDPAPLDGPRFEQVQALFNDVEFDEATVACFGVHNGVKLGTVKTIPVFGKFLESACEGKIDGFECTTATCIDY